MASVCVNAKGAFCFLKVTKVLIRCSAKPHFVCFATDSLRRPPGERYARLWCRALHNDTTNRKCCLPRGKAVIKQIHAGGLTTFSPTASYFMIINTLTCKCGMNSKTYFGLIDVGFGEFIYFFLAVVITLLLTYKKRTQERCAWLCRQMRLW